MIDGFILPQMKPGARQWKKDKPGQCQAKSDPHWSLILVLLRYLSVLGVVPALHLISPGPSRFIKLSSKRIGDGVPSPDGGERQQSKLVL
jgi:hypothetical protein